MCIELRYKPWIQYNLSWSTVTEYWQIFIQRLGPSLRIPYFIHNTQEQYNLFQKHHFDIFLVRYILIVMDPQETEQQKNRPQNQTNQTIQNEIKQRLNQIAQTQLQMSGEQLQKLMSEDYVDKILGCVFGAFMGDALGSFCQFQNKNQAAKNFEKGIQMPGGGPFMTKPGQVTDDSQMALHLLNGLLKYDPKQNLQTQVNILLLSIAKQYIAWVNSIPFDIGFTCRAGISQLQYRLKTEQQAPTNTQTQKQEFEQLQMAFKDIAKANNSSLSNGFLMRITPMASFVALIKKFKSSQTNILHKLVEEETFMTHSSKQCVEASTIYCELLSELILRNSHSDILKIQQKYEDRYKQIEQNNCTQEGIRQGFEAQKKESQLMSSTKNPGFFKIAYYFSFYAFRFIADKCKKQQDLNADLFKHLMKIIIEQGGDTDTNACIAGGLIGSIIGFKKLPADYVRKQLTLKLGTSQFRVKEETYEPSRGFINLIKLVKKFI